MMYRLGVQVCNPCDIVKDWRSYHRQGLPAPPCRQPDHPSLLLFTISSPPPPLLSSQQPNNQPSSLHTSYTSHYTPLVHPHPSSSWFDVVFVRRWPRWCWLPSCSRPLCWLVSGPPLPCDPVRSQHHHLNTHIHHHTNPHTTPHSLISSVSMGLAALGQLWVLRPWSPYRRWLQRRRRGLPVPGLPPVQVRVPLLWWLPRLPQLRPHRRPLCRW